MAKIKLTATVLNDNGELLSEVEVEKDNCNVKKVSVFDIIDVEDLCETLLDVLKNNDFCEDD